MISVNNRVNFGAVVCAKISSYETKGWDREKTVIKYRHVFELVIRQDLQLPIGLRDNYCIVYTGHPLAIHVGGCYNLRATVKRIESEYKCIRVMRPVITQLIEGG